MGDADKKTTEAERLVRAEMEIDHLKESFEEVKDALLQLAKDMHQLAVSEAERKEDRRTFERIFAEQVAIKEEMVRLWQRTDDIISAREAAAKERLIDEIRRQSENSKQKGQWFFDVLKMVGAAGLALIANHYKG